MKDWIAPLISEYLNRSAPLPNGRFNMSGEQESSNLEDRRRGYAEALRVDDLWQDEFARVRQAMGDSLLGRKPQPTVSFEAPQHNMSPQEIMEMVFGK